jgi:hypothetical protein
MLVLGATKKNIYLMVVFLLQNSIVIHIRYLWKKHTAIK